MEKILLLILFVYVCIINIIAFFLMGIDKAKSKKHAFRIPEKTLFLSAILGGSVGAILGMQTFRHKTKHWYFQYGMPAILALQLIILGILLYITLGR